MFTRAAINMKEHSEQKLFQFMFKVFPMFMIKIDYDNNTKMVGFCIKCMNCNKEISCGFNNKHFSRVLPVFVEFFFKNVGISWLI